MNDLTHLNKAQHEAVTAQPDCHMLVLAGAGSGKTKVLTSRIAHLINTHHYSLFNILAVTFTNKAANEMRGRIESLLGFSTQSLWVGTFHGLSHRLLRIHWQEAQLHQNFQITDSDDQHRIIKRVVAAMELDEKQWQPKQIQWFINAKKDEGLRPNHIEDNGNLHTRTLVRIYQQYEEVCQRSSLVDFAELLLRVHELFQQHPDILSHYQERFQHILVDEFQDTNPIQYRFIKMLAQKNRLMAVGDDDQSIYGWRGAEVENMKKLQKDFSPLTMIRLEENYRSTGNILLGANGLISNNKERLGKNLWTQAESGEKISVYSAFNEIDEARFIIGKIQAYYRQHQTYQHCAVLYRSNAQSRVLEEILIQAAIPYRIYGGLRFFDRAEIKDALGYLKLISNENDDSAFERVINMPARGIGEQTLSVLRQYAREHKISLWQSANSLTQQKQFTPRASQAIEQFLSLINALKQQTAHFTLPKLIEHVLQASRLIDHYQKEKGEKGQTRVENLQELISAARQFIDEETEKERSPLSAFLANATLESGETQSNELAADYVQLMTLHSAKGLEFPLVFLAGLEEGLFPHQLCAQEPHKLQEERRLCYVGMTRAMKKLYLTYAETRRLHGQDKYNRVSRFIKEIPEDILEEVRLRTPLSRTAYTPSRTYSSSFSEKRSSLPSLTATLNTGQAGFKLGQRVIHPAFGEGTVLSFEGNGPHARIQVKFKQSGAKWLVASYAKLETAVN